MAGKSRCTRSSRRSNCRRQRDEIGMACRRRGARAQFRDGAGAGSACGPAAPRLRQSDPFADTYPARHTHARADRARPVRIAAADREPGGRDRPAAADAVRGAARRSRSVQPAYARRAGGDADRRSRRIARAEAEVRYPACGPAVDGPGRCDGCKRGRPARRLAGAPARGAGPCGARGHAAADGFALGAYPAAPRAGQQAGGARRHGPGRIRGPSRASAQHDGRTQCRPRIGTGCRHRELLARADRCRGCRLYRHRRHSRCLPGRAPGRNRARRSGMADARGDLQRLCRRGDPRAERSAPPAHPHRRRPDRRIARAAPCRFGRAGAPRGDDRVGRYGRDHSVALCPRQCAWRTDPRRVAGRCSPRTGAHRSADPRTRAGPARTRCGDRGGERHPIGLGDGGSLQPALCRRRRRGRCCADRLAPARSLCRD